MELSRKSILVFFASAKFSIFIAVLTAFYSTTVAYLDSGLFLGIVKVKDLRHFGGVTFEDIYNLELWRIITSQLVHVKPAHMMLNVLLLLSTGAFLERNFGSFNTAMIWLVGGGLGTLFSPIWVEAPWNVGTGASHATFAMASASLVVAFKKDVVFRKAGLVLALIVVGSGLILDFLYAGYPKPGHVISFLIGSLIAGFTRKHDGNVERKADAHQGIN